MSLMEMEIPALVANSKPISFKRSAKIAELLLLHRLVELGEGNLRRNDLVEKHPADRGRDALVSRRRRCGSGCSSRALLGLAARSPVGLGCRGHDSGREYRR